MKQDKKMPEMDSVEAPEWLARLREAYVTEITNSPDICPLPKATAMTKGKTYKSRTTPQP